jgi:hypothetical protein
MKPIYPKFAGATATNRTAAQSAPITLESLRATLAHLKTIDQQWQQAFNLFAKSKGFDLEKDGLMIVPPAFDMGLVPPAYRDTKVRKSPLASGAIYFIRDPLAGIV